MVNKLECTKYGALTLLLFCLSSTTTRATTIYFDRITGPLNAPDNLWGYTITSVNSYFGTGSYGLTYYHWNPSDPTIVYGTIDIQRADGSPFLFSGFACSLSDNINTLYSINASFDGNQVASVSGNARNNNGYGDIFYFQGMQYTTYGENLGYSGLVDDVQISVYQNDDGGLILENFNATNTNGLPDQTPTIGLLAIGIIPLLALSLRQRRLACRNFIQRSRLPLAQ